MPTVSCPKEPTVQQESSSSSQINPFAGKRDMIMVVIRPIDDDAVPVETIPDEHEGTDVESLKH